MNKNTHPFKAFLYGMGFGALLMFILLLPGQLKASDANNEIFCMAQNIYFESGNQPLAGKVAVGQVVLNRLEHSNYPDTMCDVIYQAKWKENWLGNMHPIRNQCQFSWFCDGKSDEPKRDSKEWFKAKDYARIVLSGRIALDVTEGATHYHATYVRPAWAKTKTRTTRIEKHIFYRWEK